MQIRVDKDNLRIIKLSQLESGEVDVTEVNFIFTPEYEGLIKTAVFTLGDKSYKVILQNDKCYIPSDVLVEGNKITIGVYAFKSEGEELILRYSPVPVTAEILKGSYVEEAENTSHPTPTEIEQLLKLITDNSNAIDYLSEKVDILEVDKDKCERDIEDIKEDLIDIKSDIDDIEDDITSIRSDITNINENIDTIEGNISDLNDDISDINTEITRINNVDERQNRRLNGIDNFIRQWPKTEYQTGTNINLGKTIQAPVQYEDDKVLYGDTSQETTTGKNLLDSSTILQTTRNGITCTFNSETQEITFNGTCTTDNTLFNFPNTSFTNTYGVSTLTAYYIGGSVTTFASLRFYSSTWGGNLVIDLLNLNSTNSKISETANSGYAAVNNIIRFNNGSVANNFKIKIMYANSTDTTYEKYTGGIPSPNPSFPENINVVTGTQEVAVKNGNNETQATYTIHLGSLELAKIGTYQDYIYFDVNEGKWYKRRNIIKTQLTSNRAWSASTYGGAYNFWLRNIANGFAGIQHYKYCNYFPYTNQNYKIAPTSTICENDIDSEYSSMTIFKTDGTQGTTLEEWKNWVNNHQLYIACIALTPTDEEITDTTLIQDLDNILAMMSVEGTTIIEVSGNLPGSLKVRAFAQLQAAT